MASVGSTTNGSCKGTARLCHIGCTLVIAVGLGGGPLRAQTVPSPASPSQEAKRSFKANIDQAARTLAKEPRLKQVPSDKHQALAEFVVGNILFVATHEMGHAVISEMNLPVLGREEDAADEFAILTALRHGEKDFSDRVLIEAAEGWFMDARRAKKVGDPPTFYDEHGLSEQRGYQMVCLMVGSDPVRFKELADETKLPDDRRRTCVWDYDTASRSWEAVLAPYRRAADQPKQTIDVIYGEGKGALDIYAQTFRGLRFLETIADLASDRFAWRAPIVMEMRTCGEVNARWTIPIRTLHICYEMARDFAELFRDYRQGQKPSSGRQHR
jgi:Putative metallopeptidase